MLQRSATGDQLDNENDQRDHEQKMNVSAENVEADKTKKPEISRITKMVQSIKKTFRLRLLIMVRFVAGSCAYRKSRGSTEIRDRRRDVPVTERDMIARASFSSGSMR